jgi:flagellar secretion chaperone FliS
MNAQDSAFAYHQSTAVSASPVGQVVALYDTILRDLHRAIAAVETAQIDSRVNASNHAITVIGELQGVLDFERGGEPAQNLNNFYNVTRALILEASITCSVDKFKEIVGLFTRLRLAWKHIEASVEPVVTTTRPLIPSQPQSVLIENVHTGLDPTPDSAASEWRA